MNWNWTSLAAFPAPARVGIFLLALLCLWLPLAAPLYYLLRDDANLASLSTMGLLYLEFLWWLRFWSQKVYQNPQWLKQYGVKPTRKNAIELLNGLSLGLLFSLGLFLLEGILGWVQLQVPGPAFFSIFVEGLFVSLFIGLAEEMFFRGWLLDELDRDYSPRVALWVNGLVFALLHFIKPLSEVIRTFPQFPALVLLGLTLVLARRSRRQRLGICIGLHSGLVWGYYLVKVGGILQDGGPGKVSPWITGIDGNPLAGAMGLFFLGILASLFLGKSRNK